MSELRGEPETRTVDGVRTWLRLVAMAFRAAPALSIAGFVIVPLGAMTNQLGALWLKMMTDALAEGRLSTANVAAWLLTLTLAGSLTAMWWGAVVRLTVTERVGHALDRRLAELSAFLPGIEHHERPEYLDRLALLRQNQGTLGSVLNAMISHLNSIAQTMFTVVLLASLHPVLLVLPVFGLPQVLTTTIAQRRYRRMEEETAQIQRLKTHLATLPTTPETGREIRAFNLEDEIRDRYEAQWQYAFRRQMRTAWTASWQGAAASLSASAGFVAAVAFVAVRASRGEASPGDVMLAVALSSQMINQISQVLGMLSWMLQQMRTARRFTWLLDYAARFVAPSDPASPPDALTRGIELRDVTFRYPGTDAAVLQDVNLLLPAGSVVAIVGENGAGKTTLVKLLCRLYDASEGSILVDGVDIRRIPHDQWRLRTAAAFQDFAKLELVTRETVGVGDLPSVDDERAVVAALERAGASELPVQLSAGLDTQLGRQWDGGAELSVGQWQKLALSRGLMREGPLLLVLDEPTASLDAQTEHALFERFAAATRAADERSAITVLVSHRFSTVRMADLIVVIDGGRVVETGSHDELMVAAGLYAELFEIQARAYR